MRFGKVLPYRAAWRIQFPAAITPRFLYSARGVRFAEKAAAAAVLSAIRVDIAKGTKAQDAVNKFAPTTRKAAVSGNALPESRCTSRSTLKSPFHHQRLSVDLEYAHTDSLDQMCRRYPPQTGPGSES